ncbi:hypothetical protein AVEN_27463-1 [Araneus ventricosus]|uniref:Uncharacterized protein n=1 Tax=Araneus ventricosus TaxID=182803 RepID=A0A4Y2K3S7_ARAVE|nr:hypothetical protein AVEN_27463-1 [Araneus ventricosus]
MRGLIYVVIRSVTTRWRRGAYAVTPLDATEGKRSEIGRHSREGEVHCLQLLRREDFNECPVTDRLQTFSLLSGTRWPYSIADSLTVIIITRNCLFIREISRQI